MGCCYNRYVHVLVIYAIGMPAMCIYIGHIEELLWWAWFTISAIALLYSIFDWFLHEEIMHRPQKNAALAAIYSRHTLNHHKFLTDNELRFKGHRD